MISARFGLGFRSQHFQDLLSAPRAVDWLEIVSDGYLGVGGARRAMLEKLRAEHPIAMHGLSLSIAGSEPLSEEYLGGLAALAEWLEPCQVSDHLCWTSWRGHESHDLLPVAYTGEVLDLVAERVLQVQERLRRRLLLENPSAYVGFRGDEMGEAEFLAELCRRTGCGVLLDVNNLFVNACNLGCDPARYLETLPRESVGYLHVAGHAELPDVRIDSHGADVIAPVWELFAQAARRFPEADVILERDDDIPPLAQLTEELGQARERHRRALEEARGMERRGPREVCGGAGARERWGGAAAGLRELRGAAARALRAVPERREGAPSWDALRRGFWRRLVGEAGGLEARSVAAHGLAGAALEPERRAGSEPGDLVDLLAPDRPVSAARGMRVYRDAYAASLRGALAVNFPALARVLSTRDFAELAAAYLRRHPPRGYDFRGLGGSLARFVSAYRFREDYGVGPEVWGELVALEQAQLEVQDEVDEARLLAPAELAAIAPEAWEGARFELARALRILRATHDVLPVVDAIARGEDPARPAERRAAYLVHRSCGALRTERLEPFDAALLEALAAGRSFGEACSAAWGGEPAADEPAAPAPPAPPAAHEPGLPAPPAVVERAVRVLVGACARGLVAGVRAR